MQPSSPSRQSVAVVGAGAAGLGAAWLLSQGNYDVTIFEASSHAGGHAHTVDIPIPNGLTSTTIPVDAGFIVYNTRTYPDLVSLFEYLGLEEDNSSMSFAASIENPDGTFFEWGSDSLASLFADRSNLYRTSMYIMLYDMRRFNKSVHDFIHRLEADPNYSKRNITLGEFLESGAYSSTFIRSYLIPMVSAVWSASFNNAMLFPARTLFHFFVNHGLAQVFARPQWRTPAGRSRDYVNKLLTDFEKNRGVVLLNHRVTKVERTPEHVVVHPEGFEPASFDHVVFATHPPTTLRILGDSATEDEKRILGAFRYSENKAYIHYDPRFMPTNKATWSAWNFISRPSPSESADNPQSYPPDENPVCVSYWLNKLQNYHKYSVPVPNLFLTLNPVTPIDPEKKMFELSFAHPQFTEEAVQAQPQLQSTLQGANRSWFCGAYARYGFHEDAMMMGLDVAERLSGKTVLRPWRAKHVLAINDNSRMYHLPFSKVRAPFLFFLGALIILNSVMYRLQKGLGKIAKRMSHTDPVVVVSSGDGRLYRFGPDRTRTRSRSLPSLSADQEPSVSTLSIQDPIRARIKVKTPRVLVRIADSLRHGYELAPTAAAAFAACEVDCPSHADLTVTLQALFIADGLDTDASTARRGRAKFAESLLSILVGGFSRVQSFCTHTRLPELTTCLTNVVYPSWWLQSEAIEEVDDEEVDSTQSLENASKDFCVAQNILEFLGDLSERTVASLQSNPGLHATVVVKTSERIEFVSRKAELLFVRDQVDIALLSDFLQQRRSDIGSSNNLDEDERLFDLIISPALLNVFRGSGFESLAEALNFMRVLAAPAANIEFGVTAFGSRYLKTPTKKAHGMDPIFSGDEGFRLWKIHEVLSLTEQYGFELQDLSFMDHKEASMDVFDATQRMYDALATEKLEAIETRAVLAQLCLWEAGLSVKYLRRMALTFKLT